MSWAAVLTLAIGCYAFKLAGQVVTLSERAARYAALLPVALLSALVVVQTLGVERALRVDARIAGVAVAAVLLARRAPLFLVVVAASATTALVRAAAS